MELESMLEQQLGTEKRSNPTFLISFNCKPVKYLRWGCIQLAINLRNIASLLSLLQIVSCVEIVSGQAPGDFTPVCRSGRNIEYRSWFPAEWRILLDTIDYENLFDPDIPNSVWTIVDEDGDGIAWPIRLGGICGNFIFACDIDTTPAQNNWLFSQFIHYKSSNEIFFNISYDFLSCVRDPSCSKEYMTLYRYDQNSISSNFSLVANYLSSPLFGTIESSRLQQPVGVERVSKTLSFDRPDNFNGFYLGIQDEGTCGYIYRIIIYYLVCPARVEGLVRYPETAFPIQNSSNNVFEVTCTLNSYNVTSLEVVVIRATATCVDRDPNGIMCECNPGYLVYNSTTCRACETGTYRALADISCQLCPRNTMRNAVAASECACTEGFYRSNSPEEGPEVECTSPPSACQDLVVVSLTDTMATIRWTIPTIIGRKDFFYEVLHSQPNGIGQVIQVDNHLVDNSISVTYVLENLRPLSSYVIMVNTHNGVSNQDPNSNLRSCAVQTVTREGISGPPANVLNLCSVIIWQAPEVLNGELVGYDIEFSLNLEPIVTLSPNTNFFITTVFQMAEGVTFKVRAVNGAGNGQWSPQKFVCAEECSLDVTTTTITNTMVTVVWSRPANISDDLDYIVNLSGSGENRSEIIAKNGTNFSHIFSGLKSFTRYSVSVVVNNSYRCKLPVTTSAGVPMAPREFEQFCEVLVWNPPKYSNGIITGYNLHFKFMSGEELVYLGDSDYSYITTMSQREYGIKVQVRVNNSVNPGIWTSLYSNGCGKRTDNSSGMFSSTNEAEIIIAFFSTATVTLVLYIFVVMIIICICKKCRSETEGNWYKSGNCFKPSNWYKSGNWFKPSNWYKSKTSNNHDNL